MSKTNLYYDIPTNDEHKLNPTSLFVRFSMVSTNIEATIAFSQRLFRNIRNWY